MARVSRTRPKAAAPAKVPKTIKLPWHQSSRISASGDGGLVVVGGPGALGTVERWKFVAWPSLGGTSKGYIPPSIDSLAVAPAGDRVAVGVLGRKSHVEIRDRTGAVLGSVPTGEYPAHQLHWSPEGNLLVAELGYGGTKMHVGLIDPHRMTIKHVDLGPADFARCCIADDVLVFVERDNVFRLVHVDRGGKARELSRSASAKAVAALSPHQVCSVLGSGLLHGPGHEETDPAGLVDARGKALVSPLRFFHTLLPVPGGAVSTYGRDVTWTGPRRHTHCAKKSVRSAAFYEGRVLLLQDGQIEVVEEVAFAPAA